MTKQKRVTLDEVRRVAKGFGATVDEQSSGMSGRSFAVTVDLPAGRVWNSNLGHSIYAAGNGAKAEWRYEVCQDAIDQMNCGTSECDDPECDVCHPVEDE